jgi:hypothetical protein
MTDAERLETLTNIFAGYINQQTLEEGVEGMIFVSEDSPQWHRRFDEAMTYGLEMARKGDSVIVGIVNRSGCQVGTSEEALNLLQELVQLYGERYKASGRESA